MGRIAHYALLRSVPSLTTNSKTFPSWDSDPPPGLTRSMHPRQSIVATQLPMKRLIFPCFSVVLALAGTAFAESPPAPVESFHCGTCDALVPLTDPAAPAPDPVATTHGGPGGIAYAPIPQPAPAAPIVKRALFMRVDFPDAAGSQSDVSMSSLLSFLSTHWLEMSYGKMTWAAEGAGSTVTPVLRLPLGYARYTDFGTILAAARTAAAIAVVRSASLARCRKMSWMPASVTTSILT